MPALKKKKITYKQIKQASEEDLWDKQAKTGVYKGTIKISLRVNMGEPPNSSLAGPASPESNVSQKQLIPGSMGRKWSRKLCRSWVISLSKKLGLDPSTSWLLKQKLRMSHPKGAAFGTWLKGKWSCRWRTINFWTFLMCCIDVPLGCEIKCKSGWAQKQIAACNLLSVRIITYFFFFIIINAELDHIHRTFIHTWFPLSFTLILPYPWARQMEIFMRLKKVFWVQAYRVLGNTLMTNWLPCSSHRYGNSFSFLLHFLGWGHL